MMVWKGWEEEDDGEGCVGIWFSAWSDDKNGGGFDERWCAGWRKKNSGTLCEDMGLNKMKAPLHVIKQTTSEEERCVVNYLNDVKKKIKVDEN